MKFFLNANKVHFLKPWPSEYVHMLVNKTDACRLFGSRFEKKHNSHHCWIGSSLGGVRFKFGFGSGQVQVAFGSSSGQNQ